MASSQRMGGDGLVPPPNPRRILFDLLRRVEEENATGLANLTTAGEVVAGQLLLSRGRVCFVIPPPSDAPATPADASDEPGYRFLVDAAREAQEKDQRLCETLLRGRHILEIRSALRRQIAIGLRRITAAARSQPPSMELRPVRDDYDPRLMFSALESFLAASDPEDGDPADIACRVFNEYRDSADVALLFARPRGASGPAVPVPVAACGLENASLTTVVALGRSALGVALAYENPPWREPAHLVTFRTAGALWACVLSDRRLALIRTDEKSGAGQVLGFAAALVRHG